MKMKIFWLIPLIGLIGCSGNKISSSLKDKPSSETYETLDASVFEYDSQLKDFLSELDVSSSIKIEGETKEKLFEVLPTNDMYCNTINKVEEKSVLFLDENYDESSSTSNKYKNGDYIKTKVTAITRNVDTLSLNGNVNNSESIYDDSSIPTTTIYNGVYTLKAYLEQSYFSECITYPDDETKNTENRSLYTVDTYKEALNLTKTSQYLSSIEDKIAEYKAYKEDNANKVTIGDFYSIKDSKFDFILSTNCLLEYSAKDKTNYQRVYTASVSIKDGYIANISILETLSLVQNDSTTELTKDMTNISLSYVAK